MDTVKKLLEATHAVIFDLDGVLVDTAVFHFKAWKRLSDELGIPFDEAKNEELKGISRIDSLKKILDWGGLRKREEEIDSLASTKNDWYLSFIQELNEGDVLVGTLPLLEWLKTNDKKIALGSASKNARIILERTGILPYFDAIIDGNAVHYSKPDPEVFLLGAKAMHIAVDDCVVFEDAQSGIDAARAAGMKVVAVGSPHILKGYDAIINGLNEVI